MPRFFFLVCAKVVRDVGIDMDTDADEDWRLKIEDTGADEDEETDMDAGTGTDVDMDTDMDLVVRIIWHNFRYMAYEETKSEGEWKKNKRKKGKEWRT